MLSSKNLVIVIRRSTYKVTKAELVVQRKVELITNYYLPISLPVKSTSLALLSKNILTQASSWLFKAFFHLFQAWKQCEVTENAHKTITKGWSSCKVPIASLCYLLYISSFLINHTSYSFAHFPIASTITPSSIRPIHEPCRTGEIIAQGGLHQNRELVDT